MATEGGIGGRFGGGNNGTPLESQEYRVLG
jgi:hypothetical protein